MRLMATVCVAVGLFAGTIQTLGAEPVDEKQIVWRRDALDAFKECVVKKVPLVLVFGHKDGYNQSEMMKDFRRRIETEAFLELKGRAVFAHVEYTEDAVARYLFEKIEFTKSGEPGFPAIAVVGPDPAELWTEQRVLGNFVTKKLNDWVREGIERVEQNPQRLAKADQYRPQADAFAAGG